MSKFNYNWLVVKFNYNISIKHSEIQQLDRMGRKIIIKSMYLFKSQSTAT